MQTCYADDKNVQILIALLKAHGIKKIIASPGTANIMFVRSLQNDPYFEMYSSVDERSAAYIACGLAAESGEPVVLSCTGATASRNYLPGLTEAYYRKLPILAVTATKDISNVGHLISQVLDSSVMPKDVVKYSAHLPRIKDDDDWWDCEVKVNTAILELNRHGGGPVHISMTMKHNGTFNVKKLPEVRVIRRISQPFGEHTLPEGKVAVFVGSHTKMSEETICTIDNFCEANNAVVFCDHTSGYKGKYRVLHTLSSSQMMTELGSLRPDLTIHIGEITGDYGAYKIIGKEVWRVSKDGEIRDTFRKLTHVFEMPEKVFFERYASKSTKGNDSYLIEWQTHLEKLTNDIPELPFSNLWIARKLHKLIPENSVIHFAILNSLRSWNCFELPNSVVSSTNVGGFGIDGCVSSLIGASLNDKNKIYFGIIGDLAFFYDLNSTGNRHIGKNLRILLVNNGKGVEFTNFNNPGGEFGDSTNEFIAAGGHFGNQSRELVKNYSEALGFEYLSAVSKAEFELVYKRFLTDKVLEKPIILEVFTNSVDESNALKTITSLRMKAKAEEKKSIKDEAKKAVVKILGRENVNRIEKLVK